MGLSGSGFRHHFSEGSWIACKFGLVHEFEVQAFDASLFFH